MNLGSLMTDADVLWKVEESCPFEISEILSELAVVIWIPFGVATSSIRGVVLSARWMVHLESAASGMGAGSSLL